MISLKLKPIVFVIAMILLMIGCGRKYTPKEQGYYRIHFPEKKYVVMDSVYPYTFEIPVYTRLVSNPQSEGSQNSNLVFPSLHGTVHLSYFPIHSNLELLLEDNRKMVYQHTVKADAINERYFEEGNKQVYGALFEIRGNTASSVQFYATDSLNHFLRGSLYFNSVPNKDSLSPVIQFVKEDVIHLMETLSWKTAKNQ